MAHIFKSFIFAAALVSTFATASAKAPETLPVISADPAPSKVTKQVPTRVVLATNDKGEDMKYEYETDSKGRVKSKIGYKWNHKAVKWQPVNAYMVFYSDSETVLTYADFDASRGTFTKNPQQIHFNAYDYPEIIMLPAVEE